MLLEKLRRLNKVEQVGQSGVLHSMTKECLTEVPEDLSVRSSWYEAASRAVDGCEMVFLDPDIGIWQLNWRKPRILKQRNPKQYVLPNEIGPYVKREQSLVMYVQGAPIDKDGRQRKKKWGEVQKGLSSLSFAVFYDVGTHRVCFIVIPAERHRTQLRARAQAFTMNACWGKYFRLLELPPGD